MLPSRSTCMPCGKIIRPEAKLFTSLPDGSNFSTTSTGFIAFLVVSQHELAPHRSATHTLLPSLSMSTALRDPHVRPAGIFAHPSTVWYGLGASLVGATVVCAITLLIASTAAALATAVFVQSPAYCVMVASAPPSLDFARDALSMSKSAIGGWSLPEVAATGLVGPALCRIRPARTAADEWLDVDYRRLATRAQRLSRPQASSQPTQKEHTA